MIQDFIFYILGAIIVSNLIVVWNLTELPVHFYDIFNFFNKKKEKLYTRDEWEEHVSLNCGIMGELVMCPLCLATHLSWLVALAIYLISGTSPWIILYGTLSWPLFSYVFYKKLS